MYNALKTRHTYYISVHVGKYKQVCKSTYYNYKRSLRVRTYVNNLYGYKQHILEVL